MEWKRSHDKAEAYSSPAIRHYEILRPNGPGDYLDARLNSNRLAIVDTIDEGIRLCEWVERSGNA